MIWTVIIINNVFAMHAWRACRSRAHARMHAGSHTACSFACSAWRAGRRGGRLGTYMQGEEVKMSFEHTI